MRLENLPFIDYYNILLLYDFQYNTFLQLTDATPGLNLASTPWIGDLDGDGNFDIVYCSLTETRDVFAMKGMRVSLIKTADKIPSPIKWGSYMGQKYDGVFEEIKDSHK